MNFLPLFLSLLIMFLLLSMFYFHLLGVKINRTPSTLDVVFFSARLASPAFQPVDDLTIAFLDAFGKLVSTAVAPHVRSFPHFLLNERFNEYTAPLFGRFFLFKYRLFWLVFAPQRWLVFISEHSRQHSQKLLSVENHHRARLRSNNTRISCMVGIEERRVTKT
jgi:hypothetical protein